MTLKLGGYEDYDDIKRMCLAFFDASPYKELGVDTKRVDDLLETFLDAKKENKITILAVQNNKPIGVLAAVAEPALFNYHKLACEVVWWIDPEYRGYKISSEMLAAYEYWSKKVGCQAATLVDLLGNLDKLYTRKGYVRRETTYLKVL